MPGVKMPLTASRPTSMENCAPAAVRMAEGGNGRSVPPEVNSMRSAAAGPPNTVPRDRERVTSVAYPLLSRRNLPPRWAMHALCCSPFLVRQPRQADGRGHQEPRAGLGNNRRSRERQGYEERIPNRNG